MTLVYSNSPGKAIGFIDISDPAMPKGTGSLAVGGEPTSVGVIGGRALVAVNTSSSYVEPSGKLVVVDIASQTIIADHGLPGQPDSVAVSRDGQWAATFPPTPST